MRRTIKLVIIDSGYSNHIDIKYAPNKEYTVVKNKDGSFEISKGAMDIIGHGTAVYHLTTRGIREYLEVTVLKVFDHDIDVDEETFRFAFEYAINVLTPDVIHMSNGITCCEKLSMFRDLCNKARDKDIVIVAAFDNFGAVSYPAFFDSVIGVDICEDYKGHITSTGRKDITITVPNMIQHVPWLNNSYNSSRGTSFNCCYVTNRLCDYLSQRLSGNVEGIPAFLELFTRQRTRNNPWCQFSEIKIKKAIVFPYNKEIKTIIRNRKMLNFDIIGVYDIRYSKYLNKQCEEAKEYTIHSIDTLNWSDAFDTIIVSPVGRIEEAMYSSVAEIIVNKCIDYSKNAFFFSEPQISKYLIDKS